MDDDSYYPLTAIDQIANGDGLQMIKAALPYLTQPGQKYAAVYIKTMEVSNILSFYQETQDMSVCSLGPEQVSSVDMLEDIKCYCTETQKPVLEQLIQVFQAMNIFENTKGTSDKPDLMSSLLSPEQQSLFETYQTMFNNT